MTDTNVPAGWHPDPENPSESLRWWDGHGWTSEVRPLATFPRALADPSWYSGQAQGPYSNPGYTNAGPYQPAPPFAPTGRRGRRGHPTGMGDTFKLRNQASITAIIVSVIYIVVALVSTFFFIGVVPVLMTYRAIRQREPMMPLAVLATAGVIAVTVARASHH